MPLEDINAIISLSNKVYAKTNVGFHHWGILLLVLEKKAKEQGLI